MQKLKLISISIFTGLLSMNAVPLVTHYPGNKASLEERWEWAANEFQKSNSESAWIGYSIQRLMNEGSHIGSFYGDGYDLPKLRELIYGKQQPARAENMAEEDLIRTQAEKELKRLEKRSEPQKKISKEIGILFEVILKGHNLQISQVKISNMELSIKLDEKPIYWLGQADNRESIAFLSDTFKKLETDEVKEDIVSAIGLHQSAGNVIPALKKILHSGESSDIREQAAFWIGQQNTSEGLAILKKIVKEDKSADVRQKAIFGISQMDSPGAREALVNIAKRDSREESREKAIFWLGQSDDPEILSLLKEIVYQDKSSEIREKAVFSISQIKSEDAEKLLIEIAREHPEREIREKALFWLSQRASDRVVKVLENTAFNDADLEVQEKAVFAISQLPDDVALPKLIHISKTHPNPEIRKKAIFWIGASGQPEAVDALEEILNEVEKNQ